MSLKSLILTSYLIYLFLVNELTYATCPLCVAATGGALAVARFYGVPDLITGTFVGAFVLSLATWINKILIGRNNGKNYFPFQSLILTNFLILLFIAIFVIAGVVFTIHDKLIVGMLSGVFISLLAFESNDFFRKINGNKNYIPFQVIFITLVYLLSSVLVYYVIGVV